MDLKELFLLKDELNEIKRGYYNLLYVYIIKDMYGEFHLCEVSYKDDFSELKYESRKQLSDIFTGDVIATFKLFAKLPRFSNFLRENKIEHSKYCTLSELSSIWKFINQNGVLSVKLLKLGEELP